MFVVELLVASCDSPMLVASNRDSMYEDACKFAVLCSGECRGSDSNSMTNSSKSVSSLVVSQY